MALLDMVLKEAVSVEEKGGKKPFLPRKEEKMSHLVLFRQLRKANSYTLQGEGTSRLGAK